ncbi:hypothetical protein Micbo1qcDRAFT_38182 [Microdochium bolleyi]|uniref:Uncharacterized protein n=1 Tax=Microdochium bolleyi TaxID=196109 RepID=A0A136IMN0_9PEZI|nr:hypothetical protein Micbo1qcDRAFT_38182 [Microdochium bolleyi]
MSRRQLSLAVTSVITILFLLLSIHTWSALGKGGFVDLPNMLSQITTPRPAALHLQHYPKKIYEGWVGESQGFTIIRSVTGEEQRRRESVEDFLRSTMENDP